MIWLKTAYTGNRFLACGAANVRRIVETHQTRRVLPESHGREERCIVAAADGAVTVSVEVTGAWPGVTEEGESEQVGAGAGPLTEQVS